MPKLPIESHELAFLKVLFLQGGRVWRPPPFCTKSILLYRPLSRAFNANKTILVIKLFSLMRASSSLPLWRINNSSLQGGDDLPGQLFPHPSPNDQLPTPTLLARLSTFPATHLYGPPKRPTWYPLTFQP